MKAQEFKDCLACGYSMSEPAENGEEFDYLYCVIWQTYVEEDGCCEDFNQ